MSSSNRLIVILAVLLIAGSAALSVTAYSAFSADRTASINVANDQNGIIQLDAGPNQPFITNPGSGLNIDFARGNAQGVNTNSQVDIGKEGSPTTDYAFSITNSDTVTRDITLDYKLNSDDGNTATNVEYIVYNSTGEEVVQIDDESSSKTFTANSDETFYVVMNVNTNGLTDSSDLSGTLNVTAT